MEVCRLVVELLAGDASVGCLLGREEGWMRDMWWFASRIVSQSTYMTATSALHHSIPTKPLT